MEEKKCFLKFSSHVRFIDSRVRVFVFDCFLLVGCLVLFGFVFFFSFSKYNNLKQGNLKKRILKKDTPSICVKLLTEDTFKPSTIWWSMQPTVTVKSLSNDNGDVNKNGKKTQ